jgi:hypothetical protein
MANVKTISLEKFTASVQAAVQSTLDKHPKFKFEVPNSISVSYLIRGIPVRGVSEDGDSGRDTGIC